MTRPIVDWAIGQFMPRLCNDYSSEIPPQISSSDVSPLPNVMVMHAARSFRMTMCGHPVRSCNRHPQRRCCESGQN